jgi:hypothetical protein
MASPLFVVFVLLLVLLMIPPSKSFLRDIVLYSPDDDVKEESAKTYEGTNLRGVTVSSNTCTSPVIFVCSCVTFTRKKGTCVCVDVVLVLGVDVV